MSGIRFCHLALRRYYRVNLEASLVASQGRSLVLAPAPPVAVKSLHRDF